jgi:pyruvate dehydrogenase E1 component alpha subunit
VAAKARTTLPSAGVDRFLDRDGTLLAPSPMTDSQLLDGMARMLQSRALDERATKMQRLGRLGTYGPVLGQEASVVGSAMALDPKRDWLVPAYREQPAMLHHGLTLTSLLAIYMGRFNLSRIPDHVKMLPRQQAVGAQIPHAVGLAWALSLRSEQSAVLVYFGEGASSEGDFHEAANLAGVTKAPVIFFLQNNGYAISTPRSKQSAATTLSERAVGYGFPGTTVDGNDLMAVYSATCVAVERAIAGEGPTLIESITYRVGFHNTTDNPREYRDDAEVAAAAASDPISRLRNYLTARGLWSTEIEQAAQRAIASELDTAVDTLAAEPLPSASEIRDHVYAGGPIAVRTGIPDPVRTNETPAPAFDPSRGHPRRGKSSAEQATGDAGSGPTRISESNVHDEVVPLSAVRRAIAENVTRSKASIPHASQTQEVDMAGIRANREANKARIVREHGVSLSYLPYVVAATASALRSCPQVNSTFAGDRLILHREVNLGIAIGLDDRVLVPVLRRADTLSVVEIAAAIADLAQRARDQKITADELRGATFTVNNSGTFGTVLSYSVIPPGQSGILTMEAVSERPVARNQKVVIRPMMYLCLSLDHRVMDGILASQFLRSCRAWLEDIDANAPIEPPGA